MRDTSFPPDAKVACATQGAYVLYSSPTICHCCSRGSAADNSEAGTEHDSCPRHRCRSAVRHAQGSRHRVTPFPGGELGAQFVEFLDGHVVSGATNRSRCGKLSALAAVMMAWAAPTGSSPCLPALPRRPARFAPAVSEWSGTTSMRRPLDLVTIRRTGLRKTSEVFTFWADLRVRVLRGGPPTG
jgi:hypothetical protein